MSTNRGLVPVTGIQPIYLNNQSIALLLKNCPSNLSNQPITQCHKILADHWVDTINDLRLLIQEGLIDNIGLPIPLRQWIESEVSRYVLNQSLDQSVNQSISQSVSLSNHPSTVLSLFQRPDLQPRIFRYVSDFDTNGIIYWLGTRNSSLNQSANQSINQPDNFVNPALRNSVRVTCSGLMKDSQPINAVTDRALVRCVTSADSKAFIQIELVDCLAYPLMYSLKHYSSWDTECVRNWKLEASVNGIEWVVLTDHVNDQSVNGIGSTHTWPIQLIPSINQQSAPNDFINPSTNQPINKFFRFFKLQLTGSNSNSHLYLACSGFELYGAVLSTSQHSTLLAAAAAAGQPINQSVIPPINTSISAAVNHSVPMLAQNGIHPLDMPHLEDVEMRDSSHQPIVQPIAQPIVQPVNQPAMPLFGVQKMNYVYQSDFDENGIIYAICSVNQSFGWSNAADDGFIKITASSVLDDSVPMNHSIGRQCVRCVTQSKPQSWICWDLIDKLVIPTAYTLRHYSSWDTEALRYWRFEASANGIDWLVLKEHINDQALDQKCKSFTWEINNPNPLINQSISQGFRMFRLFQTGENSNKHHHLACSGFELYGQLLSADRSPYDWSKMTRRQINEIEFTHIRPFDDNGVIHWFATRGRRVPWSNPHLSGAVRVTASSLTDDSETVDAIVGHSIVRCVTQSMINSWISIDLLTVQVRPTAYSLRHYSSWDNEALRNWRFEGSISGSANDWILIHNHRNDPSLEGKGSTFTWKVKTNHFFRSFRIVQYEENSNKHHYLACSGFELYGTMRPWTPEINQSVNQLVVQSTNPFVNPSISQPINQLSNQPVHQLHKSESSPISYSASPVDGVVPMVLSADQPINQPIQPIINPLVNPAIAQPIDQSINQSINQSVNPTVMSSRALPPIPAVAPPVHLRANSMILKPSVNQSISHSLAQPITQSINQSAHQPSLADPTYHWDADFHGQFFTVNPATPWLAKNGKSLDKWQMVASRAIYPPLNQSIDQSTNQSIYRVGVSIVHDAPTTNTWKFIIGVIPSQIDPRVSKQWVGTAGSWGFIAGTGGKCHGQAQSINYGESYGQNDIVGITMNFATKTIEFSKNLQSFGIAFDDLSGPVRIAVSATGADSCVQLVPFPGDQSINQSINHPFIPINQSISQTLPPAVPRAMSLPISQVPMFSAGSHWDEAHKSEFLTVESINRSIVTNIGSKDKWQSVRSLHVFTRHSGTSSFDVEIFHTGSTPNQWVFIIGVAPPTFTCVGNKQWVGAAGSWGYIAGTGGKCFTQPKSITYGSPYGQIGDVITVCIHWSSNSLEFKKNGVSQGIAFDTLEDATALHAAVSLTATGSKLKLNVPFGV